MNKYNKWWMRFTEEPDDKGGGAAVFDIPAKDGAGDHEPPETKTEESEVEVEPKVDEPTTSNVDVKALAREFGTVLGEQFKKKEDDEKPALTAEEAKKLLNVWDPSPEWIAKFDNLETRNAAIAEMRDGLIKHGDTISQHRLQELKKELETKFSPVMERLTQMDNEAREKRFATSFPQLSKPTLRPLLEAVAGDLAKKGKKFDDESSMFAAIASGAEAVIKETNPDFKLTAGSSPAPTKTKSTNSIPVTTAGAGGGTAAAGDQKAPAKKGLAIFAK